MTIEVSKSYLVDGVLNSSEFEVKNIKDLNQYFKDITASAKYLGEYICDGSVKVDQTKDSLYINYLDVPGINSIDSLYRVKK
jgi:hypothetical protein